jgi:hypothetical protein
LADWVAAKCVGGVSEVTLLTPIKRGTVPGEVRTYEQRLYDQLRTLQLRIDQGVQTPIGRIPTIHFARWLILAPGHYLFEDAAGRVPDHNYTSWLFFTSNFDGDMETYLRDFATMLAEDVDRIWGNCEGYPASGSRDFDVFWNYAKKYQLTTHTFANAYPGLTVARIHELQAFRRLFDAFVATTRRPDGKSIDNLAPVFDRFLAETMAFPQQFPALGGTYDADQPTLGAES